MLKLNWKDAAIALPDFVDQINEGNSFDIDIDFVIRCLFAVSDLGTKFDIDMLRKKTNLQKLQNNFKTCCNAIKSTIDNVQKYCWVSSSKAIGGSQNLVPFVYYLFHTPKHQLDDGEINNFRKSFFLFSFAGPFSRYADSRLGKFIREELKSRIDKKDYAFPLSDCIWWIDYWERLDNWDRDMIQRNPRLAMYIIQQDAGLKTHYELNSREIDHIFPRSKLREKDFNEAKINHFANFWILSKGKNLNKSNKHPKKYFEDVPKRELKAALIDKELLDYRRYNNFIKERENEIIKKLSKRTGISESDFEFLYEE
jgi:5-methylcytosine-specific restriction endonuclease McrA